MINTHRGLFRFCRLPFSIASAPGTYFPVGDGEPPPGNHRGSGISGCPDNGKNKGRTLCNTGRGPQENEWSWFTAQEKQVCPRLASSVVYLCHWIDEQGLHPLADKIKALQDTPSPKNLSELKSYLGLLTYYAKFLPNLSTLLAPLYELLKQSVRWKWLREQEKAFRKSKKLLLSSQLLVCTFRSSAGDPTCSGVGRISEVIGRYDVIIAS